MTMALFNFQTFIIIYAEQLILWIAVSQMFKASESLFNIHGIDYQLKAHFEGKSYSKRLGVTMFCVLEFVLFDYTGWLIVENKGERKLTFVTTMSTDKTLL